MGGFNVGTGLGSGFPELIDLRVCCICFHMGFGIFVLPFLRGCIESVLELATLFVTVVDCFFLGLLVAFLGDRKRFYSGIDRVTRLCCRCCWLRHVAYICLLLSALF